LHERSRIFRRKIAQQPAKIPLATIENVKQKYSTKKRKLSIGEREFKVLGQKSAYGIWWTVKEKRQKTKFKMRGTASVTRPQKNLKSQIPSTKFQC